MDMYWSLSLGFHENSTSFSQPKKSFSFAHQREKKNPQYRLITVDVVLSSCLPLRQMRINLHMSLPSSTHPWLEGCIVLYHQQVWQLVAAIEEICFDWQAAAANVLWVSFFCLHLHTVFFSDIVNWIPPAVIDERTTTTSDVRQTERVQ